jgi:hypothetical protein
MRRLRSKLLRIFAALVFIALAAVVFVKKAGPAFLRLYVQKGLGDCHDQAVFCVIPFGEVKATSPDKEYLATLAIYRFDDVSILAPKDMKVVRGPDMKVYYKKRPWKASGSMVYLLHEPPGFFTNLYPQLASHGIYNDYDFLLRAPPGSTGSMTLFL